MPIEFAIQHLAIKEGYDMVQFSNGNYGFVAYYNGVPNGFEIIGWKRGVRISGVFFYMERHGFHKIYHTFHIKKKKGGKQNEYE